MKVLVAIFSETDVWRIPRRHVERLRERFPHHTFAMAEDQTAMAREAADADVAFSSRLRGDVVKAAPRLRWIHSSAAGVGSLLSPELIARGIVLTNSRGVHGDVIAEHVVGVTIMAFHKLHVAVRRQAEGVWAQQEISADPPIRLLRGATVGIVGLGAVGAAVARACRRAGGRGRRDPAPARARGDGRRGVAGRAGGSRRAAGARGRRGAGRAADRPRRAP